jgi:hypothetical protein
LSQRSDDRAKNRRRGRTAILSTSPYKQELEDLTDKSKAKRRIISTDNTLKKGKGEKKRRKQQRNMKKDIKMIIQRHLMEKTRQLAFFVMNCFRSPNQKKGGLNAHDAMNGSRNSVQELTKWMMISRTSAISVTD